MNRPNTPPRSFTTDQLHAALGDVGGSADPDYLTDIVAQAGRTRQRPGWAFPERWLSIGSAGRHPGDRRTVVLFATLVLLALLAAAVSIYVGSQRSQPVNLGTSDLVVGRVDCRNPNGVAASTRRVAGAILGCSRDGTRLLIQKDRENLFVLHDDGSETQVTGQLTGFNEIPGSARPRGATIAPDGSRVVFAGLTKTWEDGHSCHDGGLFAVDTDGGPAELLWTSQIPQDGLLNYPVFSPDGTRIAFADGYCDSSHTVWLMNADGSDAHQILVAEGVGLEAGHVYGLAWSPAGDRIALSYEGGTYSFAPDGSDFRRAHAPEEYCWPGHKRC